MIRPLNDKDMDNIGKALLVFIAIMVLVYVLNN
jgi:hypothetical protein